jgi:hypothetical protein
MDKLPDWTGIWTHDGGTRFDPKIPNYQPTSAKLTPEYKAKFDKKLADQKQGIEWDHLSYCLPAGFPRWITEAVPSRIRGATEAVWWINEQQSEVRRIYTDGRAMCRKTRRTQRGRVIPSASGTATRWRSTRSTTRRGSTNRGQPDYSDKVSTVEKIAK